MKGITHLWELIAIMEEDDPFRGHYETERQRIIEQLRDICDELETIDQQHKRDAIATITRETTYTQKRVLTPTITRVQ